MGGFIGTLNQRALRLGDYCDFNDLVEEVALNFYLLFVLHRSGLALLKLLRKLGRDCNQKSLKWGQALGLWLNLNLAILCCIRSQNLKSIKNKLRALQYQQELIDYS